MPVSTKNIQTICIRYFSSYCYFPSPNWILHSCLFSHSPFSSSRFSIDSSNYSSRQDLLGSFSFPSAHWTPIRVIFNPQFSSALLTCTYHISRYSSMNIIVSFSMSIVFISSFFTLSVFITSQHLLQYSFHVCCGYLIFISYLPRNNRST